MTHFACGHFAHEPSKEVRGVPEMQAITTEVLTQYSSQLSSDLERNAREQEEVRGRIEELRVRLQALEYDHDILVTMQQALESGIPLQQSPASTSPAGRNVPAAVSGATRQKPQTPTLVALIRSFLSQQPEPCSAAEITAALSESHPDRVIKTTVVRTTVESLVARGVAERLKQGHSVFYASCERKPGAEEVSGS
ncbi:hypothetical protein [Actinacidiphila guanduensis]|uniref:Uncharacterized protein n=1 Tax=Actinacidiphila guanduensis TaxID=310781 RepID=A0A1H0SCH5_9ACTN|nr:hypothetical protein [Actinacidiphila guanduensis]SDP39209.1 hypothetical protein SAMN05216259_1274 [Actinacidiphila guanduensis]